jgi:hypothetical protein
LHNVGDLKVAAGPFDLPAAALAPIFSDPGVGAPSKGPKGWTVELPPYSSAVFSAVAQAPETKQPRRAR